MAASAVYFKISPAGATPGGSAAVEFSNIGQGVTPPFHLMQGRYIASCVAADYGTVELEILSQDGATYLLVFTAFSANGMSAATDLPDGTYRLSVP